MPVFSRVNDGVLVLTIDGDYTANELRRVGFSALESDDSQAPVPVLLDLSGAAGMGNKAPSELSATGALFGVYRDRLTALAVVAPADISSLFDQQSDFASEAGVQVKVFTSHAEARDWLAEHD
jgi:hypothetical protein